MRATRRLARFFLTGCVGFGVDFGTLVGMHGGAGVPLPAATTTAYVVGGVAHYSLTRFWVFPTHDGGAEWGRVARYLALSGVNIVATLIIVVGLDAVGLDYRAAKLLAVATLFFTNYYVVPRFVMRSAPTERRHAEV